MLILIALTIFILSSIPGDSYPEIDFKFADKIVHILIYAPLFIAAYISFSHQDRLRLLSNHPYFFAMLFSAIYGASDELHQLFTPKRSCDFYDWIADVTGALVGMLLVIVYNYIIAKKKLIKQNTAYDSVN